MTFLFKVYFAGRHQKPIFETPNKQLFILYYWTIVIQVDKMVYADLI